jgi:hypothetical protein
LSSVAVFSQLQVRRAVETVSIVKGTSEVSSTNEPGGHAGSRLLSR